MDFISLFGAMTATSVLSVGVARYLSQRLLEHRLSKDLKVYDADISKKLATHKAELDRQASIAKAEYEALLKKEIEEYLGDKSAERSYKEEAKKRLYLAVGPLRFQLLVAAAELANRVARIGEGKYSYDMSLAGYFGRSSIYRLLRILAICELIERQVAYADFAVDPDMRSLLKFKRLAFICLSSDKVSLGHSKENWVEQKQHVFYDVLGIIASTLIVHDSPALPCRVMRFDEFSKFLEQDGNVSLVDPIPGLIEGFTVQSRPILWMRLVALAQLCIGLLELQGDGMDFEISSVHVRDFLELSQDTEILSNLDMYQDAINSFHNSLEIGK